MFAEPGDAVDALYDAISFDTGGSIDFDLLSALFIPGARLIHVKRTGTELLDLDTFVDRAMAVLEAGRMTSFCERELHRRAEIFGHMAHVMSSFELYESDADEPTGRGVHSIQLLADDEGWRIANVVWQNEEPDEPIPPELLPPS
jgi:hypothetical protein